MEFDLVIRHGAIIDGTGRPLSWPNTLIRSLNHGFRCLSGPNILVRSSRHWLFACQAIAQRGVDFGRSSNGCVFWPGHR
jgi:hypothetical protein